MPLPGEKRFFEKVFSAITEDEGLMEAYFSRFDAYYDRDFPGRSLDRILGGFCCYGGYHARTRLIKSIPVRADEAVLDIGPEMGMEAFLLAEVYQKVFVAEPDERSCEILESLGRHYFTENGEPSSEILDVRQSGIIPEGATSLSLSPSGKKSGIYAFDARGARDISHVFGVGFAARIYASYLVEVMPKAPKLNVLLGAFSSYCGRRGQITWAESIPELREAAAHRLKGGSSLSGIKNCISELLPGFRLSCKILEKPRQLLTVAGRI